jgi:hypothetical protein
MHRLALPFAPRATRLPSVKLRGRHLDTTEVMEADSQAAQTTTCRTDAGKGAYARKGAATRVMVASGPKVLETKDGALLMPTASLNNSQEHGLVSR